MHHKTSRTQNHYPFGMLMPTRTWDAESSYRFGFQGQERDDEIKGAGNSLNYTFHMHDPRLGRFFAVDPLTAKYPFYSPYQFSENRAIDMVELEGCEPAQTNDKNLAVDNNQSGTQGSDFGFATNDMAETATQSGGYIGDPGRNRMQITYNPSAKFQTVGNYMWQKPIKTTTNSSSLPNISVPQGPAIPDAPSNTSVNFSFNAGTPAGMNTSDVSSFGSIPPNSTQIIPTGAINSIPLSFTSTDAAGNQVQQNTTLTQQPALQVTTNSTVQVTISTIYASTDLRAAGVIANRQARITTLLNRQGIPSSNIFFNPTQWNVGGLPQNNRTQITATTTTTTQPILLLGGQSRTTFWNYNF